MVPEASYLWTVIALPALGAAAVAAILVRTPWGRRPTFASSAVAAAAAVAVLWSFLAEVDPRALLRQFPVTLPDDDAPFERWHRVALAALVLVALCPGLSWATAMNGGARRGLERRRAYAALACLAVGAFVAGFAREFTGTSWAVAISTGVACAGIGALLQRPSAPVTLGALASWALTLAALSGASGFPSLAAVSASMALACAALAWVSMGTAAAPPGFALAAMAGVLLACGRAYSDDAVPAWAWWATFAVPTVAGLIAVTRAGRKHAA